MDRLDDATLIGAFDQMNLQSLAQAAKHSQRVHEIILNKFVLEKFRLNESEIDMDLTRRVPNILHGSAYIGYDTEATLTVLKLFGPVFSKLRIIIDLPGCPQETVTKIAAAVAEYCSKASQTIELSRRNEQFDVNFTFPHAKEVILSQQYDSDRPVDTLDLNVAFPRMQKLQTSVADYLRLDRHFPHLTHFTLFKSMNTERFLKTFIQLNPQLRGLETPMLMNFPHLQKINEMLPNLEVLGIRYTEDDYVSATDSIHFEKVTKFTLNLMNVEDNEITASLQKSLSLIKFTRLESFQLKSLRASEESKQFLLNMIAQYDHLSNLEFEQFDLTADEILALMNQLPRLETITLSCTKSPTVAEIRAFLVAETNLKEVRIYGGQNGPTAFFRMKDPLGQWQVVSREINHYMDIYVTLRRIE